MNTKRLIGFVLCLAMLAPAGCGKKSSDTPAPPVSQPTSTTSITGLATKGPINSGTVTVFAIRSGVTDTAPLGQARTDVKGIYTVETFGYQGPVVVEVIGGSYKDEISRATVTVKVPLRAMFSSAGTGTTTMAVTPLTELAVNKALGSTELTNDVIDASNRFIASYFGLTSIVTSLPSSLGGATDDQKNYAIALGGISQLVIDFMQPDGFAPGQAMDDALAAVINRLGGELQQAGVFSSATVSAIDRAKALFSDGVGTTTPPSIIPPPPPPAGGVLKIGTAGIPTSNMNLITVTLNLPPGVTVDTVTPGNVTLSGVAAVGARGTIAATFTAGTGTAPGTVAMTVQNAPFGVGEFATVKFKMDPQGTFPASPAAFTFTGFSATLHLTTVGGISAVPISLTAI
jgi:hypothetical protein